MGERAAMGGRLGRFLQCIERTCADVAIDDTKRSQCGDNRKTFGVCRFTWVRNSHRFPRSAFFAAQSASGRRELLGAVSVDLRWTCVYRNPIRSVEGRNRLSWRDDRAYLF